MVTKALVAWLGLLTLAILNGSFREAVIIPRVGTYAAHVASTIILCLLILAFSNLTIGWIDPPGSVAAWRIGALWLVLTVAFEFLAGHYLFGHSWNRIIADYNVFGGRVWVLVLLTTATAPTLAASWRQTA